MDNGPEILDGHNPASVERAVTILREGGLVAFPTETVYGLGADALNGRAVASIFEVKRRPRFDPLIIHVSRREWVKAYTRNVPPHAEKLMDRFWPGPLTIILEKQALIPDIVTSGLATVAVRMPSHPVALDLIARLGKPVAAPSANPFGYVSPTKAAHVARMFAGKLPVVLDGGSSMFGLESTIVSVRDDRVMLHRHGAVSLEELVEVVGEVHEKSGDGVIDSPGQLPYHYAPHKPLKIVRTPDEITTPDSSFLAFRTPCVKPVSRHVRTLSPGGDLREAAAHFFSFLIELDREDIDIIFAEQIPEAGLGKAMMERLKKAARKNPLVTH
jgi:L-threonylcarbamoyladenylate synthase